MALQLLLGLSRKLRDDIMKIMAKEFGGFDINFVGRRKAMPYDTLELANGRRLWRRPL